MLNASVRPFSVLSIVLYYTNCELVFSQEEKIKGPDNYCLTAKIKHPLFCPAPKSRSAALLLSAWKADRREHQFSTGPLFVLFQFPHLLLQPSANYTTFRVSPHQRDKPFNRFVCCRTASFRFLFYVSTAAAPFSTFFLRCRNIANRRALVQRVFIVYLVE